MDSKPGNPTSEFDIFRSANLWAARHGAAAVKEARKMAQNLQRAGDLDRADVWLRILVAIETMRTARPEHLS